MKDAAGVVETIVAVGEERQKLLLKLREAVRKKDLRSVFEFAEKLVGLSESRDLPATPHEQETRH